MGNESILAGIKESLQSESILFSEDEIGGNPTVIGYDKRFRWKWMATQLNTFIVASDFGDEVVTPQIINKLIMQSLGYAKLNYSGWPRGVQSSMAVIAVALSKNIDEEAAVFCNELKARKSWTGFSVPVAIDTTKNEVYHFEKNPLRGIIYYPYFRKLIVEIIKG